jgi:uncharacterized integral membrane protein (TIGR00698 family)
MGEPSEVMPRKVDRRHLGDALLFLGFAGCLLLPVPPPVALALGAALALSVGHRRAAATKKWTTRLLQASVVGLGAGMDLAVVLRVGAHGFVYTVVGIAGCLAIGLLLGRLLRVPRNCSLLVSIGTAICGGSAIAAAAPPLRARDEEVSVSLATVFVLNGVALFAFPAIGRALHLQPTAFGLWAALAIHDTSSVVGAAIAFGPAALATATTVKLARALWIVPTTGALGWWKGGGRARVPLFIVGFVAASALATFIAPVHLVAPAVAAGARRLLVATLFLVGAGLSRGVLAKVGARPLVQGLLLWATVASLTLGAVLVGLIR